MALAMASLAATAAAPVRAADTRTVEDLVLQGFQLVAQGRLLEAHPVTCYTLKVLGDSWDGCRAGDPIYGRFRRLTRGDEAFVCVSFRNWTCFRSDSEAPAP